MEGRNLNGAVERPKMTARVDRLDPLEYEISVSVNVSRKRMALPNCDHSVGQCEENRGWCDGEGRERGEQTERKTTVRGKCLQEEQKRRKHG